MKQQKPGVRQSKASFVKLRQKLLLEQDNLLSQFQRDVGEIPADDPVAVTRLKLIYRQKGLNI